MKVQKLHGMESFTTFELFCAFVLFVWRIQQITTSRFIYQQSLHTFCKS